MCSGHIVVSTDHRTFQLSVAAGLRDLRLLCLFSGDTLTEDCPIPMLSFAGVVTDDERAI